MLFHEIYAQKFLTHIRMVFQQFCHSHDLTLNECPSWTIMHLLGHFFSRNRLIKTCLALYTGRTQTGRDWPSSHLLLRRQHRYFKKSFADNLGISGTGCVVSVMTNNS